MRASTFAFLLFAAAALLAASVDARSPKPPSTKPPPKPHPPPKGVKSHSPPKGSPSPVAKPPPSPPYVAGSWVTQTEGWLQSGGKNIAATTPMLSSAELGRKATIADLPWAEAQASAAGGTSFILKTNGKLSIYSVKLTLLEQAKYSSVVAAGVLPA